MSVPLTRLDIVDSTCRHCGTALSRTFVNLGATPPANSYLRGADLNRPESFLPLHVFVCESCLLVQLEQFRTPEELFADYPYFSSYSDSWLAHAQHYAETMIHRFGLGDDGLVIEVASNDGYLLQFFDRHGVRVLGIEPAANVAEVAVEKGVPTLVQFFGTETARRLAGEGTTADLLIANNVLAHVPNVNDFVNGLRLLLEPDGVITVEFPHLLQLMRGNQFDTIYHEHFSYFSLLTVEQIFAAHGLKLFDVDELATHGGSLRIYACHQALNRRISETIERVRAAERQAGLDQPETYDGFARQVNRTKRNLLSFLIRAKADGKTIVGYGAPAKGNTLLNFCGIGTDFLDYTVDRSPHKQGMFLPGTRIPIRKPAAIAETRPDYVLILPWNLKDEIVAANAHIRDWGGRFVVPIPEVEVVP